VYRLYVIPTPVICIIVSIIVSTFVLSLICRAAEHAHARAVQIKQGLVTLSLLYLWPSFTLYCSNAGLKNLLRPSSPISGLLSCSIRSVLAGQLCTAYISTLVVGRARAPLRWPTRHGTLICISEATSSYVLYVVLPINAWRRVLIADHNSIDDSHMSYLGYSSVLSLVSSMGCLQSG